MEDFKGISLEDSKLFVGIGWHSLLENAYAILPEGAVVYNVKEKWGGLDITIYNCPNNYAHEYWVYKASIQTCELCGKKGKPRYFKRMWVRTLCFKHFITTSIFPYVRYKVKNLFNY